MEIGTDNHRRTSTIPWRGFIFRLPRPLQPCFVFDEAFYRYNGVFNLATARFYIVVSSDYLYFELAVIYLFRKTRPEFQGAKNQIVWKH
jgi:hypothetical protein